MGTTSTESEPNVSDEPVVSRRLMIGAASFAVPAVALLAATPAFAASDSRKVSVTVVPAPATSNASRTASTHATSKPGAVLASATTMDAADAAALTHFDWIATATVMDAASQPLVGEPVSFWGTNLSFGQGNGYTGNAGVFTTTVSTPVADMTDALLNVSSSRNGAIISTSSSLALQPATVTVSASADAIPIGGAIAVSVSVLSAFGTPMPNVKVALSGEGAAFTNATGVTDSSGAFSTTVAARYNAGSTITLGATATGSLASASGSLQVKKGKPVRVLKLWPSAVIVGARTQVVATLTDAYGNPVVGQGVTLQATDGVSFSPASGTTDRNGEFATATLRVPSLSSTTVTASSSDGSGDINASTKLPVKNTGVAVTLAANEWSTQGQARATRSVTISVKAYENGVAAANRRVDVLVGSASDGVTSAKADDAMLYGSTNGYGAATFTDTVGVTFSGSSSATLMYQVQVQGANFSSYRSGYARLRITR